MSNSFDRITILRRPAGETWITFFRGPARWADRLWQAAGRREASSDLLDVTYDDLIAWVSENGYSLNLLKPS